MTSGSGDDPASDETAPLRGSGATEPQYGATLTAGGGARVGGAALHAGDQIDRFILLEQLGAGGMGVVFAARDADLERRVAIKVLRAKHGQAPSAAMRARLLREAQAAARLSHRNVVTVHEVGAVEDGPAAGQIFIAMELVDGETLTKWQATPRAWRDVVATYLQAARGLAAAHAAGLVHRDFKPDNVLVGKDGEVRVTDFGLAAVSGEDAAAAAAGLGPRASGLGSEASDLGGGTPTPVSSLSPMMPNAKLTSTGDVMGTPLFMAPEQRKSRAVDARADQYAFCVALFRALYGVYPFGVGSEESLARRAEAFEIEVVTKRGVPAVVNRVVARGLKPDPGARWRDMAALIAALEETLGAQRRKAIGAAAVGGGIVVAAGLAFFAMRGGASSGSVCSTGERELQTVWNADARGRASTAFGASGVPDAGEAWRRVEGSVDAWGRDWQSAFTSACRAARVEKRESEAVLARREACLTSQLDVLAGVLHVWQRADREIVGRAAESALRLPRIADCATPPPVAPGGAAALRQTLSELTALHIAGNFVEALPRAREALGKARELGDRSLEAEAGILLGRLERNAGEDTARSTFFDAAAASEAAGRDDLAVEAWSDWIYVASAVGVADAEIEAASRRAEAALRRAGEDRRLLALLRNNQGNWAYETKKDAEAIRLFEESLALRTELYGPDDPRVADILDNLGNAWGGLAGTGPEAGRDAALAKSVEYAERGLAIRLRAFGEDSAATARSLHNTASAYETVDRLDEADAYFRRSLGAKERVLGVDHPMLGTTLVLMGRLAERRGRLEESLGHFQRAAKLWDRAEGVGVGPLCTPLGHSIDMLMALGRPLEAIAPADRCAEVQKGDPPKARGRKREAALARLEAGQTDVALAQLRDLVAAESEAYAIDDPKRARTLVALARAEHAAGRKAQALATLAKAERLVAAYKDASASLRADTEVTRAELERSRPLADQALRHCADESCGSAQWDLQRRAAAIK
ncbi:MAG TPA: serine/threonine-protein kinase [Kofleriaceae bacterium]|nr:serine/threonine-protein kinase [Kofleriaceae bacterium]